MIINFKASLLMTNSMNENGLQLKTGENLVREKEEALCLWRKKHGNLRSQNQHLYITH